MCHTWPCLGRVVVLLFDYVQNNNWMTAVLNAQCAQVSGMLRNHKDSILLEPRRISAFDHLFSLVTSHIASKETASHLPLLSVTGADTGRPPASISALS